MTNLPGGVVLYPSDPYILPEIKTVIRRLSFLRPYLLADQVQDAMPEFVNSPAIEISPYGHVRFLTNA